MRESPAAPLTLSPSHWYSWNFKIKDARQDLANIDMSWWREKGTLSVAGQSYRVYRENLMSGDFILESGDGVLARAAKPSAVRRAFELSYDGLTYTLRARSAFRRAFVLEQGTREVGSVVPEGALRRRAVLTLPEAFPLPVKVFVAWLTVLIWKRDSNGAAGG